MTPRKQNKIGIVIKEIKCKKEKLERKVRKELIDSTPTCISL